MIFESKRNIYNKKVIIHFTVQYEIYLDLYTAWSYIGLAYRLVRVDFSSQIPSKCIPLLYTKMFNNL